ncbi:MAG: chemotaxis protein CheW [Verrucomicrobia bacterium]|nr:chemotaxis protein CheW [Verrucomicrobiota bacterium]
MLMFQIGVDRYALETSQVAEVLPLVHLQRVPHAPPGVAGLFDFHHELVPVVDLSELMLGRKASVRISTRIILVRGKGEASDRAFGLIAERTTGTLRRRHEDFVVAGLRRDRVPLLERVTTDAEGVIYWLDLQALRAGPLAGLLDQTAREVA